MHDRTRRGGATWQTLLLLLVIAGAAGAFNYHRNYQIELQEQGARKFSGYSDADLDKLASAYRAEIEGLEGSYVKARDRRVELGDRPLLGERVREFERVQGAIKVKQGLTSALADAEARLREIEEEQAVRTHNRGFERHLRRLLSV